MRLRCLLAGCLLAPIGRPAPALPSFTGETLAGQPVALPAALQGKRAVLVLGFSRKAGGLMPGWTKRLEQDYGARADVAFYGISVIDKAPRFVRGLIRGGMRSDLPKSLHPRFVLVTRGPDGDALRQFAALSDPDSVCVVVTSPAGEEVIRVEGPLDEARYRQVQAGLAQETP